tara:strand:- start:1103 stop:1354 length:252 start_codon:yes stop_codon:yes gene_type:complete
METVEQMAADIAMKMNGGEWTDGKWYSQGHRDAWVKAVQPYADEIVKLREALLDAVGFVSRADNLFLKQATTDTLKGIPDGYR